MSKSKWNLCCLVLVLFLATVAQAQGLITTFAGHEPDAMPAVLAPVSSPKGIAVDSSGNVFIAGYGRAEVYEVHVAGQLALVAGNSIIGYGGDGGPATSAMLQSPRGVAVDSSGNLFIADEGNRVRRVDATTGVITTIAGNGNSGFGGDGGPATNALLNFPAGVAVDSSGNVFIADSANHRIRRISAATGIINTVAGNGMDAFGGDAGPATNASLDTPSAVAVDGSGNLFIADTGNQRIRRVSAATGVINTVAGNGNVGFGGDGGPATSATLRIPLGLAVDNQDNMFIADTFNSRIRRVDAATGVINTVAGSANQGFGGDGGPATSAALNWPVGMAVDSTGNMFISDTSNNRIRRVDAGTGVIATVAGNGTEGFAGDGLPATSTVLYGVSGISFDSSGNIFFADKFNQRIRRVDATTGLTTTVAGNGANNFFGDGGPATIAALSNPSSVVADGSGNLFIADTFNNRIRRVDAGTGVITTVAGNGAFGFSGDGGPATSAALRNPRSVAVDSSGNLFIADSNNNRVRRADAATGVITTVAGNGTAGFDGDGGPATSAALNFPTTVVLDSCGDLFIADAGNNRIRSVDAAANVITTVAGNGNYGFSGDDGPATSAALANPWGVAVDGSGNLFVADSGNQRVRSVDAATGVITTVAGNGTQGFSGDGGPATSAAVYNPAEVAIDSSGNLFIATGNRIRRVTQ